jgi:aminomuconate-semialdehyde/2-hydroxymuconate-6-semialdehyde dehydrogenase|tara:strand:+ start:943 stop:2388 length:1446 start_codon:yes stop_codon:yes gene_type:complete
MITIKNFIGGNHIEPLSNKWLEIINPSNGKSYGKLPNSNEQDVELAFMSAEKAFTKWSLTSIKERGAILQKIAKLIEQNIDVLAKAESLDNGKPLSLSKNIDIPRAAENFRFFGQAITQFYSESHDQPSEKNINFTLRQPIGVVGCISPWNLPLYLFTWKIAPALAAGNCVVAKPSEITPYTAYLFSNICNEAGLPKGVLNIVNGNGEDCGQAIVEHPGIKAISFTGGSKTGIQIAKTTAPMLKKLSLELGGKNPNIIFSDCDYDKMLNTTLKSSFSNQGQICLCGSRIFVEYSIYEKFKSDFIKKVKKLKVGIPSNSKTDIGALVSKTHMNKILSYINDAKNAGNKILCGGNRVKIKGGENGFYVEPTVIEVFSNDCKINQEEIFGPVVTIMPFKNDIEVLKLANNVKYGLSASVWTSNLKRTMYFSQQLNVGIVWINTWMERDLRTPFGGVKDSGMGREGGFEVLRFFTESKNICINYK